MDLRYFAFMAMQKGGAGSDRPEQPTAKQRQEGDAKQDNPQSDERKAA